MDANSIDPNSLSNLLITPWWKDILLVLVGGLCASAGSVAVAFASIWYQAKKARQIKMEETIGQQKVNVYRKALRLPTQLHYILIAGIYDDVLDFMETENPWVLENEIFLPAKFTRYWHSVRHNIYSAKITEKVQSRMADGDERDKKIKEIVEIDTFT